MIKTCLYFSRGNAKLHKDTAILSLPAGHTCPFAKLCKASTNRQTGKIVAGPDAEIRCYAVTPETLFPNIRASRWHNFELLRNAKTIIGMANLIESSLITKKNIKLVRMHQSGDFFNQSYFDAWLIVAKYHPEWIFYGYTKALPYWIKRLGEIPTNFKLTASRGGTHDHLIETFGLRSARIVLSEREAKRKWHLPIDHDDTHGWQGTGDFAILIHGTQPIGSKAGKAWYRISRFGKGGYKADYFGHSKNKDKTVLAPVVSVKPTIPARQLVYA